MEKLSLAWWIEGAKNLTEIDGGLFANRTIKMGIIGVRACKYIFDLAKLLQMKIAK